jgi:choline dehydrogenase-like flavoprotein
MNRDPDPNVPIPRQASEAPRPAAGVDFDVIVVGSGPAGSTIARELSRRGKRVLILERGGDAPLKEGLGMASFLSAVSVSDNLSTVSAFTTGGTTSIYFAVADSPPLDVFQSLGVDLSGAFDEVKQELPLAVLPDELLGAQALRVRRSAEELGYPCHRSTMLVDLAKCDAGYRYEAKWNARAYLREAVAAGSTLITRARVLKVLVENDRAIGVEYSLQKSKKHAETRHAFAGKIVLSAGAAATPRILRNSGMLNVASKGFYCHPGFAMFGTVRGMKTGDNFVGSTGTIIDGDISVGDGSPARVFYRMLMLSSRQFLRAVRYSSSIGVGVMVSDGLGGGLREDGSYYKTIERDDVLKLKKGEDAARRIIQNAGGRNIVKLPPSASHIGGTIRFGEHIDASLETEIRNLHVCDGSMIPESVKVSPTLTLICLGKYLANQISKSM